MKVLKAKKMKEKTPFARFLGEEEGAYDDCACVLRFWVARTLDARAREKDDQYSQSIRAPSCTVDPGLWGEAG